MGVIDELDVGYMFKCFIMINILFGFMDIYLDNLVKQCQVVQEFIMKVFVIVKCVIDYNVKICVKFDGSDVDLINVKMVVNLFCEIVVEEVVCMKEKGIVSEIVVVLVGVSEVQE